MPQILGGKKIGDEDSTYSVRQGANFLDNDVDEVLDAPPCRFAA